MKQPHALGVFLYSYNKASIDPRPPPPPQVRDGIQHSVTKIQPGLAEPIVNAFINFEVNPYMLHMEMCRNGLMPEKGGDSKEHAQS